MSMHPAPKHAYDVVVLLACGECRDDVWCTANSPKEAARTASIMVGCGWRCRYAVKTRNVETQRVAYYRVTTHPAPDTSKDPITRARRVKRADYKRAHAALLRMHAELKARILARERG